MCATDMSGPYFIPVCHRSSKLVKQTCNYCFLWSLPNNESQTSSTPKLFLIPIPSLKVGALQDQEVNASITGKVKDQMYSLCLIGCVWRVREIRAMAYSFLPWCEMMVSGGWSGGGGEGENGGEAESNLQKHDSCQNAWHKKYS